ncbi:MAG: hypothetical protein JXA77_11425, partial [Bacteroidales bacterium]|nr:hypothetical protein [Bacteroidales bacterium]
DNMLRLFYGRMYYNMNNWYLMMSFIPGYNRNKKNLEQMITSNMTGEVENEIAPGLLLKMFYPLIVIVKLIFLSLTTSRFKSKVKRKIKYYRIQNFENYDWQKCLDVYADLRTSMLEKWHIPVENDFLVMSYFGILKRNIPENELQEMVNFDNISIRQINQLSALSKQFYSLPELQLQIDNLDVENYELTIDKYPEIKQALNSYFDVYGGRFANELKLESPDIEEDSQKLLKLLKLYKNFQPRTTVSSKGEDKLPDKFFLRFALKKFKKYASKREEMRLLRSNSFSLVRKIFNRMGAVLSDANLIDEAEDIYYVDIDTLLKAKSVSKLENLQSQIKKRKQLYSSYNIVQPLPYFKLADGDEVPVIQEGYFADEILNGRPCTPGTMEGTVRVFPEYFLPETIDFDVLVTSHTDPGWTPLIGLSKALIIEHGGVLSHAAIVSRELGIPTVIGLQGATQKLKTGEKVSLNGSTGQVIKISGK